MSISGVRGFSLRGRGGRMSRSSSAAASFARGENEGRSRADRARSGFCSRRGSKRTPDVRGQPGACGANPALEELFYFGPHPGNFAFESATRTWSRNTRSDSICRCAGASRASGEVTYFRNDIRFVFRSPLSVKELEAPPGVRGEFPARSSTSRKPRNSDHRKRRRRQRSPGFEAHGDFG